MFYVNISFSAVDRLTPHPSGSESVADESTTRSGMSPIRLPNLLPGLDESAGLAPHSDSLSRWLMGSMPRAGSAVESESYTRPGTTYSELRPQSKDVKSKLSVIDSKSILKVSPFLKSRLECENDKGKQVCDSCSTQVFQLLCSSVLALSQPVKPACQTTAVYR